jgi:uncharacterized protein
MQSIALMLKRALWGIFLCLALISYPLPSLAVTVQEVPNPQQVEGGWVTDMADLLDFKTKAKLNQIISHLEAENGTEVAIVTIPDTAPSGTLKQFATQLFKYWGIGKTGINNGVLLLISKNDRRVEIETGYGLEKIVPKTLIGDIINQQILPNFEQGEFADGILAGTEALIGVLERRDILSNPDKQKLTLQARIGLPLVFGLIGAVVLWGIVGIVQALNDDGDDKNPRRRNSEGSSDSSYDSSSWSNDGGSFGGGDSGGGGDGGSW